MSSWYHEMGSYQHQRMRKHPVQRKIPVVLIGGFLGSGKTTLANHVLAQPEEARTDVVVREYGLVSIDDKLMRVDSLRVRTISGATKHMEETGCTTRDTVSLTSCSWKRAARKILRSCFSFFFCGTCHTCMSWSASLQL